MSSAISRSLTELTEMKNRLEKALVAGIDENREAIKDILEILRNCKMSYELLKKTKIGAVVNDIKKKEEGGEIRRLASSLIKQWKDLCPDKKEKSSEEATATEKEKGKGKEKIRETENSKEMDQRDLPQKVGSQISRSASTDSSTEEALHTANYSRLPDARRKIVEVFRGYLEQSTTQTIAAALAFSIEMAVDGLHSFNTDNKQYFAKVRQLQASLKRNEVLRNRIISGEVPSQCFPRLSAYELAPLDQQEAMKAAQNEAFDATREDWLNENRSRLMKELGLDPNVGSQYVCKCGSNKTDHYAMQTRSADEPMTVFVTCLDCGNRWRSGG